MIETILQIDNGIYPFDEINNYQRIVKVTEVQIFSMMKQLTEKKKEMQAKNKLINSPYIIKMTNIYQDELTLHYFYEHIPQSLKKYIQQNYKQTETKNNNIAAKLFIKKISYDLTSLIAYLAHLKIEIQLNIQNLGITTEEKLKLYMNTKCKMGHKTELNLVAYYSQCKDKIINHLETVLNLIKTKQEHPPNFKIKGNQLVFPNDKLNQSIYSHCDSNCQPETTEYQRVYNTTHDSNLHNSGHYSSHQEMPSHSTLPKKNNLRQTQSPNFSQSFNFSEAMKGSKSKNNIPKNHKSSFQFGTNKPSAERFYTEKDNDNSDAKSYTHSRSIRIEMQQKVNPSPKKQRKDSYKVKITTFHQYQMDDCNPNDIFSNVDPQKNKDIFEYFQKQANSQHKNNKNYQSAQESKTQYKSTQPTPFQRKQSMTDHGLTTTKSTKNLQQKVRMAKEKAQNILNRYMKSKNKKVVTLNKFGK